MIRFGMWSTLLLVGSLHGVVIAALLLASVRRRPANLFLALLLVAVVLMITPYTLGYAGVYDAAPWLTFAPFYWQLAFGPLLYLFVRQLAHRQLPRGWAWHFLPAALEGGYYLALFVQPLETKWRWNETRHLPVLLPLIGAASLGSLAIYWALALRQHRRYQHWLSDRVAHAEELRLRWIDGFLWAIAALGVVAAGFLAVDRWRLPLDYYDYFPMYVATVVLVYFLGVEGWRNAHLQFPPMDAPAPAAPLAPAIADAAATDDAPSAAADLADDQRTIGRDWSALGQEFAARTAAGGWWREPELSATDLARRLGTNLNYLSRALNEGLGQNFAEFINRQRVAAACELLRGPGDILAIALAVGFGSKASFNRAFKAYAGMTPSAFRSGAPRRSA